MKPRTLDASSHLDDLHQACVQHDNRCRGQTLDGGQPNIIDRIVGAVDKVHDTHLGEHLNENIS